MENSQDWSMESNTSTRIMKMEYYIKKKLLVVTFKSGATYEYLEVPPKVAGGFMQTNSIGKYFDAHIRDRYNYRGVING